MKKRVLIALVVVLALAATASLVWADDPVEYTNNVVKADHKVRNKWDMSGSFTAQPGYNWGGLAEGATWTYRLHIKEAMNGDYSVGSIHFMTDGIDVVGHVEATKMPYSYWSFSTEVLAAVGWAEYNGVTYDFMFLLAEKAMWFTLGTTPYDSYWDGETVWGAGLRAYQLHSKVPDESFLLDYKVIHDGP